MGRPGCTGEAAAPGCGRQLLLWDFNPYIADIVDEGNAVVLSAFERPYDEEPQKGDLDDEFREPWTDPARSVAQEGSSTTRSIAALSKRAYLLAS